MSTVSAVLRLGRPLHLLLAALTYVLGVAIARYLGHPIAAAIFWLGLVGTALAPLTMNLLAGVFRMSNEPAEGDESPAQRRALREAALQVSIAALAAQAFIAFLLYREGRLMLPAVLCLGFSLVVILAYAVPPLRLLDKGFGEMLLAIQIAYLVPSISFLLQAGAYHALLNVAIIPLTLLLLAGLLALDFSSYASDVKYGRHTLLVNVGWERAVPLHDGLIVAAYVLLLAARFLGFSFGLLWPAFLTLPFAVLQIYWLRNIARGAKPIWSLLTANALAVFCLMAYFLTLTFWLR